MVRAAIFSILYLLASATSFGQGSLVLVMTDSLPQGLIFEHRAADKNGVQRQADKIVNQLMNKGFLLASHDSIRLFKDTAFVTVFVGQKFNWGNISYKYIAKPMLNQFGFEKATTGIVSLEAFKNAMNLTLTYFENTGYPFAYFYWDSLVTTNDTIAGSLYFEKNIEIRFDTLALYGDKSISKNFLYNYLGFRPGQPYDERVIATLSRKLMNLPYITVIGKPQVFFVGRKAIVLLNIKKRKTDRLDGLIGFSPNTGEVNQTKLLVTGEFHLDFKNLKGTGKGIKLDWQSFNARSQTLGAEVILPYIFNQAMGVQMKFDFLKFDTLYTETRNGFGTHYYFSGLNYISAFYEQRNTNLLYADTISIRKNRNLGSLTALKTSRYGLTFNTNSLDNRLSPTKGYFSSVSASLFKREVEKDRRIANVKFYNSASKTYTNLYDSIALITYQTIVQYTIIKPIAIRKKIVLYHELVGYHFISPSIYFNELYRFGGNKSLNGFNEQSLYASTLAIITSEIRYLLSENSFVKVFGNAAYYKDQSRRVEAVSEDIPYGFGGGINLETGSGIFNISIALGKSRYIPLDFKNAKVHFGVINYF